MEHLIEFVHATIFFMAAVIYYRELLIELTKREIKQRYKQSVLGYAWVILNPLLQMLVMSFVFSKILRVDNLNIPYPLFLYAGLLPWTLFSASLVSSTNSLVGNAGLLTKIYFPRVIFVQSSILSKMFDFFLSSIVFILFMIAYQQAVSLRILFIIPLFIFQSLFTYALSLLLAAFNLFYRDIQYVLNLIILIWMYMTPVIYPIGMFPIEYHWIFSLNPMAVIINSYRWILFDQNLNDVSDILLSLCITLFIFFLARYLFKKMEGGFADVV